MPRLKRPTESSFESKGKAESNDTSSTKVVPPNRTMYPVVASQNLAARDFERNAELGGRQELATIASPALRGPPSGKERRLATNSCEHAYKRTHRMTKKLSSQINAATNQRLDSLAKRSTRSNSSVAAEAIAPYLATKEWQLEEIHAGIADLDAGKHVSHEEVQKWLGSWATSNESKAPQGK